MSDARYCAQCGATQQGHDDAAAVGIPPQHPFASVREPETPERAEARDLVQLLDLMDVCCAPSIRFEAKLRAVVEWRRERDRRRAEAQPCSVT